MIIGLGHKYQSGKGEVARVLVQEYGFKPVSFAGYLKEAARIIFGLSESQVYGEDKMVVDEFWTEAMGRPVTPGNLLQLLGTEAVRGVIHTDVWARRLQRRIESDVWADWVIDDVRFKNEAGIIRSMGGIVVRVDRENRPLGGRDPNHASEIDLDDYADWDFIIDNNGSLDHLREGVTTMMGEIYGERPRSESGISANSAPTLFPNGIVPPCND